MDERPSIAVTAALLLSISLMAVTPAVADSGKARLYPNQEELAVRVAKRQGLAHFISQRAPNCEAIFRSFALAMVRTPCWPETIWPAGLSVLEQRLSEDGRYLEMELDVAIDSTSQAAKDSGLKMVNELIGAQNIGVFIEESRNAQERASLGIESALATELSGFGFKGFTTSQVSSESRSGLFRGDVDILRQEAQRLSLNSAVFASYVVEVLPVDVFGVELMQASATIEGATVVFPEADLSVALLDSAVATEATAVAALTRLRKDVASKAGRAIARTLMGQLLEQEQQLYIELEHTKPSDASLVRETSAAFPMVSAVQLQRGGDGNRRVLMRLPRAAASVLDVAVFLEEHPRTQRFYVRPINEFTVSLRPR